MRIMEVFDHNWKDLTEKARRMITTSDQGFIKDFDSDDWTAERLNEFAEDMLNDEEDE